MPYYQSWEEFSRAAEKLYLTDPMKVNDVRYESSGLRQVLILLSAFKVKLGGHASLG